MSHDADMDNKRSEIYVYLKLSLFFHFSRWAHLKWIDEGHLTALGVCLRCLVGLCLMRRQESTSRTRLSVSTTTQHERICGHRVRTVMRCLITVQLWTLIATWFSQFTFQLRALAKKKKLTFAAIQTWNVFNFSFKILVLINIFLSVPILFSGHSNTCCRWAVQHREIICWVTANNCDGELHHIRIAFDFSTPRFPFRNTWIHLSNRRVPA